MKNNKKYRISLIGSGKVAAALGHELIKNGFTIYEIYSRTYKNAASLAKKLSAHAIKEIKSLDKNADLFIMAVNDDAIISIAKEIRIKDKLIVHTSGSVSMDVLKKCSKNHGVFYPLQTFTGKGKMKFEEIPVLIEGNSKKAENELKEIGKTISKNVQKVNSINREKIHLSAVLVSNFPNYLYTIAEEILKKQKQSFQLLLPLIKKVTANLEESAPSQNQTGPAFRKDKKIIAKHLQSFGKNKREKLIYSTLSEAIMKHRFPEIKS